MAPQVTPPDVCLVEMPLAGVVRPSLALSLLKALLERHGIRVKVVYASLWFVDFVGSELYRLSESARIQDGLVDWLFGAAAFPDFAPDCDTYLARLHERNRELRTLPFEPLSGRLRDLRQRIPDFVRWVAGEVTGSGCRVVGCSSTFQQHVASLALLRQIGRDAPAMVTMMGGANCEGIMGRSTHANFPWVDVVVSGEADGIIARLVHLILDHGRDLPPDSLPPGVFVPAHRALAYPGADGAEVPRLTFTDLDSLPVPDCDDYFRELERSIFRSSIRPGLVLEASRGCWWGQKNHCTFCGLNAGGMAYRSKGPERILDEIGTVTGRHGVTHVMTTDNIIDRGYFHTVLPALARSDRRLDLFFETKSTLDAGEVRRLAEAGVRWIQPGIESLHSGVLRLMRKGATAWQNVRLLKACRQYGVRAAWTVIVGSLGEEDRWYAEMAEWLPLISHLQPRGLSRLRFDRFSPYFDQRASLGLTLRPAPLYQYVYPLDQAGLADLVYFFEADGETGPVGDLRGAALADRPGVGAFMDAFTAWSRAWLGAPPELTASPAGPGLAIRDTRACAVAARHRLDAIESRVLRACDEAPQPAQMLARLADGGDPQPAAAALARLRDLRLVIDLDGRVLSLVLDDPVADLPPLDSFPGGWFHFRPAGPSP